MFESNVACPLPQSRMSSMSSMSIVDLTRAGSSFSGCKDFTPKVAGRHRSMERHIVHVGQASFRSPPVNMEVLDGQ